MARTGRPKKDKPKEDTKSVLVRMPALLKLRLDGELGKNSLSDWIVDAIRGKLDGQPWVSAENRVEDQRPPIPIIDLKPAGFGLSVADFLAKSGAKVIDRNTPDGPSVWPEHPSVDEQESQRYLWADRFAKWARMDQAGEAEMYEVFSGMGIQLPNDWSRRPTQAKTDWLDAKHPLEAE